MFTLAHVSDLHVTPVRSPRPWAFLSKRALGLVSWIVRRSRAHRPWVVERLLEDLAGQPHDHIAITGDLTNVALEEEFAGAAAWLARIGAAEDVFLVPGNHDAYVAVPAARGWDLWRDYLVSDGASSDDAPTHADYPTLRIRGEIALVGLCSAQPKPWLEATGTLGEPQLERAARLLAELRERGLCRVVLVHHPVVDERVAERRRLSDSPALRGVLAREGAELVLHGHGHRQVFESLEGPTGAIPVVGVRSASDPGTKDEKRAQYHLYEIERAGPDGAWSIRARTRGLDPTGRRFVEVDERAL